MPGLFDPASFFTAGFLLASSPSCPLPDKEPVVEVVFTHKEPVYIKNLTSAQLAQNTAESDRKALQSTDAAARYTADRRAETLQVIRQEGKAFTGGYTTGALSAKYEGRYSTKRTGLFSPEVCVYVDKIALEIVYSPTIYVSADYHSRPCAEAVITAHEKNHVARDLLAISVFLPRAEKTLKAFIASQGGQGPYPGDAAMLADKTRAISDKIGDEMTAKVFNPLGLLRAQYQAVLDTPANYLRQSMLCPSWQWKNDSE